MSKNAPRGVRRRRPRRRARVRVGRCGQVHPDGGDTDVGLPGHRHRRTERSRVQPSRLRRPARGQGEAPRHDQRAPVEELERLHPELLDLRDQVQGQPGHRRRLPDGVGHPDDGEAVPEHEVGRRRHERRDRLHQGRHHQELRGPDLRGERGRLRGRLHRGADGAARSLDHRQLGRRHPGPGGRPLHRGLPGGRQEGRAEHQRPERLLAGLRRAGQVQEHRAQPDLEGLQRRLPGRRRLRPRRPRRGEGEERLGHRRRRRPVTTSTSGS